MMLSRVTSFAAITCLSVVIRTSLIAIATIINCAPNLPVGGSEPRNDEGVEYTDTSRKILGWYGYGGQTASEVEPSSKVLRAVSAA